MASLPSRLSKGGRNCGNFIYSEEVSIGSPPIFLASALFSAPLCFPEIMNSAAFSAVRFCLRGILSLPPAQPTETSDDG